MGHIFISYNRDDVDSLQILVNELLAKGIKRDEIWYDADIKAGEHWIPHIDAQLADTSCLVVIVTKNSMKSLYVTYEWSFALGNALPIIPLLFKDTYDCLHPRLRMIHTPDCTNGVDENVIQQIKDQISENRDTQYLHKLVLDEIIPTRLLLRTALWFFDHRQTDADKKLYAELIHDSAKFLNDANIALPKLMVDKSFAFNVKQRRTCRNLCNTMSKLWSTFMIPVNMGLYTSSSYEDAALPATEILLKEFEPNIKLFEMSHYLEFAYNQFNDFLNAMSKGQKSFQPLLSPEAALSMIYPENEEIQNKIKLALQIVKQRLT